MASVRLLRQVVAAALLALGAWGAAQTQWSLSRTWLPSSGGTLRVQGVSPAGEEPKFVELSSSGAPARKLPVYVTASTEEGLAWESAAVLPPSPTLAPQVWTVEAAGRKEELVVEPRGILGEGTGLKAVFSTGPGFRLSGGSRTDAIPWLGGGTSLPPGMGRGDFSVRWSGSLTLPAAGRAVFRLSSSLAASLSLGGVRRARLKGEGGEEMAEFSLDAKAGEVFPFDLTASGSPSNPHLRLEWSLNGGPFRLIPQSQFTSPDGSRPRPTLILSGPREAIRVRGSAPSAQPLVQAVSPYGEEEAWVEVYSFETLVGRWPEGFPIPLPASKEKTRFTFRLRFAATDASGALAVQDGPEVVVDPPLSTPSSPPQPLFNDWDEAPRGPLVPGGASGFANPLGSSGANRALYEPLARKIARRYGLDEDIFCKLVETESSWNPNAVSRAGAMGLGQLMPGTAEMLGVGDPFDPASNLDGAARYLAQQLKRFKSYRLALAAYNAGPGNVIRHRGVPPFRETQNYVRKILADG